MRIPQGEIATNENDLIQETATKSGKILLVRICGKFIKLGFQIFLARILGVFDYGLFIIGFTVIEVSKNISIFGLNEGVVRYLSPLRIDTNLKKIKGILLSSYFFTFVVSLAISVLLVVNSNLLANKLFHNGQLSIVLKLLALSLPIYVTVTLLGFTFRGFHRQTLGAIFQDILLYSTILLFVLITFLLGLKLQGILFAIFMAFFVTMIIGFVLLSKILPNYTKIREIQPSREIFRFSATVFFAAMSYVLLGQTDRLMLGILGSANQVGIYNSAFLISIQIAIFLGSINTVFAPMISKLYTHSNLEEIKKLYVSTTRWCILTTLPLFVFVVSTSKHLMLIFGPDFVNGWPVLLILCFGQLFNAVVGSVGYILIMSGRQKLELFNSASCAVLNVFLNVILINLFGVLGAALATSFSIVLINIIRLFEVRSFLSILPYDSRFWKPFIASIPAAIALLGVRMMALHATAHLCVSMIVLFTVYLSILKLLGYNEQDKILWNKIKATGLKSHSIQF